MAMAVDRRGGDLGSRYWPGFACPRLRAGGGGCTHGGSCPTMVGAATAHRLAADAHAPALHETVPLCPESEGAGRQRSSSTHLASSSRPSAVSIRWDPAR